MRTNIQNGAVVLASMAFVIAGAMMPRNAAAQDTADGVRVKVSGGGTVIQVLPGPSPFTEDAMPLIDEMPADMRERYTAHAEMGPYSNNTSRISGQINASFWDRGETGDEVDGEATFTTEDGSNWRVVFTDVQAQPTNEQFEPTYGGVAVDREFHGDTRYHSPYMPRVNAAVAYFGTAEIYRDDELVRRDAPVHVMMTNATRNDDFDLACFNCTDREVRQLHLMVPEVSGEGELADGPPGGFLNVSWEQSTFERTEADVTQGEIEDDADPVARPDDDRVSIPVEKDQ